MPTTSKRTRRSLSPDRRCCGTETSSVARRWPVQSVALLKGKIALPTMAESRPHDRQRASRLARQALPILERVGYSTSPHDYVDLRCALARAREGTREYPPASRLQATVTHRFDTRIPVENATVLEGGRRMAE